MLRNVHQCLLAACMVSCQESPTPALNKQTTDGAFPARIELFAYYESEVAVEQVGVVHDKCDLDLFQLPIGGRHEVVFGIDLWGGTLAYGKGAFGELRRDLYYFDVESCTEYRLSVGLGVAGVSLRGHEVAYNDNLGRRTTNDQHCKDIYMLDLRSTHETQVTKHPHCEWNPVSNGRYLVYQRSVRPSASSGRELLLLDRSSQESIQLVGAPGRAAYFDIGAHHVVWSGYTPLTSSIGRDVFYYDLNSRQEVHIKSTSKYYCYDVQIWGDYITYSCSEYWLQPPYHLKLYHIPTGAVRPLTGEFDLLSASGRAAIHRNLVVWSSAEYRQLSRRASSESNLVILDIVTDVERRITVLEQGLTAVNMFFPYVLLSRRSGRRLVDYFLLNLVKLGVVDRDGRLLAGGVATTTVN